MTTALVGDTAFLANYLIDAKVYAVVVEPGAEEEFVATFEVQGDKGTLTMAAIIGPRGPAGIDMFILSLQTDEIDGPDELPETLENTDADIGKMWVFDDIDGNGDVVGSSGYLWYGNSWRRIMIGTPGPPGPTPVITPSVELVDPDTAATTVDVAGTDLFPTHHFKLAVPRGPIGPAAALALCPDIDYSGGDVVAGDVLGFTGQYTDDADAFPILVPVSISQLIPSPYSMPENAFSAFSGLAQRAAIGSFALPPQPFPWTPVVWGHIGAFGLEISTTPLTIGGEVLLGHPTTGAVIGRGFGNSLGKVPIMPHYSTPGTASNAISPTNGVAAVPANHTSAAQGTVYVNLYNDGAAGVYRFNPPDSQLFVMVVPINPTG